MGADSTRAPERATTLTTNADADIIAAWERFSANRLAVFELSDDAPDHDEQEERLWNAIGDDEAFIGKAIASTPLGAEVQLWCVLSHETDADSEPYALRRDLAHFDVHGSKLNWCPKLTLQAIRSLRSMSSKEGGGSMTRPEKQYTPFSIHAAAYWAARTAYDTHRKGCLPAESESLLMLAYEDAYGTLVGAMHDSAVSAIKTPAANVAEIIEKVAIIDHEGLIHVRDLFDFITDDIEKHVPGAYGKGGAA